MADRKWWTLTAVGVATFMLLLDITIVNVALPDIQRSLHASFSDLQWVVDAYALTLAAALLVSGSMADIVGRRMIFTVGLVIFSAASLLCGLAQSPAMLASSRALQGIGGAMMFSTSLALIAQAFQGAERATAFGVIGAVTGASVAVGPLIGGALTDGIGWRSIFLVNVPVGVVAVVITLRRVLESRDPNPSGTDWWGALTFSGALFLLVFSLIRGNTLGWSSTQIVTMLVGAVALLVAFVGIELRRQDPLFDFRLFRKPAFSGASTTAFTLSASMFAMFLYITLYLQNVLGYSPLTAGIVLLPITLLSFVVAPAAGRLSSVVPVRLFLGGGLLLVAIGLLLMARVQPHSSWTALLPGFILAGAGVGMVNPPLASAAIGVVPPQRSGMASGINSTFRQVGIATGIAALGAIFQSAIESRIGQYLAGTPAGPHSAEIGRAFATGGGQQVVTAVPPQGRALVAEAARHAFTSSLNELFMVGAVIALVGSVVAFVTVRQRDFVVAQAPEPVPVAG